MREILFRGKRIDNGKWVYGYYVGDCGDGVNEVVDDYAPLAPRREVDPATVGQYTGLTDRNGKKIFEGDIVKTQPFSDRPYSKKARYKEHIGVVEYKIYHFKNSSYEQDYEARWRVSVPDFGGFACYDWSDFYRCEVIGNRWDNPELLEDVQND